MGPLYLRRTLDEQLIRFNGWVLASDNAWLAKCQALIRELGTYALYGPLAGLTTTRKKKFAIYAQERTGSTLLVDLLNCNPRIHCDREIFAFRVRHPMAFLNARRGGHPFSSYGCKLMSYQLERQVTRAGVRPFMLQLHDAGWKIIYLKRRNVLRQAISHVIMEVRGKAHRLVTETQGRRKFHIEPARLQTHLDRIAAQTRRDEQALKDIPYLSLEYEANLLEANCHQSTIDQVSRFLDIPTAPASSRFGRITSNRMSDFIENIDEVSRSLGQTHYAHFLH